ncbi:hypothetical protein R6Q57_003220 [Mikania cordata]
MASDLNRPRVTNPCTKHSFQSQLNNQKIKNHSISPTLKTLLHPNSNAATILHRRLLGGAVDALRTADQKPQPLRRILPASPPSHHRLHSPPLPSPTISLRSDLLTDPPIAIS